MRARRKSAASDQATRNFRRKNAELAIRVRVAASDLPIVKRESSDTGQVESNKPRVFW
jgi:predicted DNA binding CopG/RHH family protein